MSNLTASPDAERARLLETPTGRAPWRHWGPYVSERAWGTVREDYSADGSAWDYFPHDHARSRAYRWNEDGLAGICDDRQTLCLALAFWNGRDPILKERIFGLSGPQGNHGEDAKEYWFYLDATPTHSWMRWRYMYPQDAFPYERLVIENGRRSRLDPEFELADTGVFQGGYWEITAEYAKAAPEDILLRVTARNLGADTARIDVLPTIWFRNTWSWEVGAPRPRLYASGRTVVAEHHRLGSRTLQGDGEYELLFCENETNESRLWGAVASTPYPKDGINDHVVHASPAVNPALTGTKAALHYRLAVGSGESAQIRLRLSEPGAAAPGFEAVMRARQAEADAFYASITPADASVDEALVLRQAFAGMLWCKQFYHFEVGRWLDGDPTQPTPPPSRHSGRDSSWRHLNNQDVLSMPDKWEYPWYAAWDLGFHCVALAHLDPEFAKHQLTLLCREWYMHPNGQLPAYEWSFGDVNPPVHAWAARKVFEIAGDRDYGFLERIFHKLLINFTWWVNRKDAEGRNVFQGGFLGLDNIGPFDRSAAPEELDQSDGSAWMAMYCLSLLELSLTLAGHDAAYEDIATKFFEHFTMIALAMNHQGLWDEEDGFYYDVLHRGDGTLVPLRARSMVGLIPLFAVTVLEPGLLTQLNDFARRMQWYVDHQPAVSEVIAHTQRPGLVGRQLLSVVNPDQLRRVLGYVLSEDEFLSPFGVRALSRYHRDHPFELQLGGLTARLDYEPGESTTGLFGGNSNWRGPVWFPLNHLLIERLRRFHHFFGDDFQVECPTGSGHRMTLDQVADEISRRLISLFLNRDDGRPALAGCPLYRTQPEWRDVIEFHEYFHGDTGAGLGASHQTGWTGLVADLITRNHAAPVRREQT